MVQPMVSTVQIELKSFGICLLSQAAQIVDYKKDPGNGYTKTLLCFVQLFIVSNQTQAYYFANNNNRHFVFDADENFLPVYLRAVEKNSRFTHVSDIVKQFSTRCTSGNSINHCKVTYQ